MSKYENTRHSVSFYKNLMKKTDNSFKYATIFLLLFQILLYFGFCGSADGGNEVAVLPAVPVGAGELFEFLG